MFLSIWRWAHLSLAILSFSFLSIAAGTGVILGLNSLQKNYENKNSAKVSDLTLAESLPIIKKNFSEITSIKVDEYQNITLDGFDKDENEIKVLIDPKTGKEIGKPEEDSQFIQSVTSLHRSLFLHETGRFLMGITAVILFFISFSGLILVLKRQKNFLRFFQKIKDANWATYFHVFTGRIMLIPIVIISLTGAFLFLIRFDVLKKTEQKSTENKNYKASENSIPINQFKIFETTKWSNVESIEFPFVEDIEEYYILKLKDKEITLNQFNGSIVSSKNLNENAVTEKWMLAVHKGSIHPIWAAILVLASVNIIGFIISGFTITFKRKSVKIKNNLKSEEAEYIILVGSENNSTFGFATEIFKQLKNQKLKVFIGSLNDFSVYPKAKELLIFTATYGNGDAPQSARNFLYKLPQNPQNQTINTSIIGFGSHQYENFCGFAKNISKEIEILSWVNLRGLYLVDEKSTVDFVKWVKDWSDQTQIPLGTAPDLYQAKKQKANTFTVSEISETDSDNPVFKLILKPAKNTNFQSGDLLLIYPNNDHQERFYSIGKVDQKIQLMVRLHKNGLGSEFLKNQKVNEKMKGVLLSNSTFHLPKNASKILMIANGTGIAPFLGMIHENVAKKPIQLFAGFSFSNKTVTFYHDFLTSQIHESRLSNYQFVFSKENNEKQYVMDLLKKYPESVVETLQAEGAIMLCGSLSMQKDIENLLIEILSKNNLESIEFYKNKSQILTDCY